MFQDIFIIDEDVAIINQLKEMFQENNEFKFKRIRVDMLDEALKNIPALIIIHEDTIQIDAVELCRRIRINEDNSITPILVITSNTDRNHRISVLQNYVEYYIKKPLDNEYLYYTIKNVVRLMYVNRRVSPLTGLPGNVQIQAEMKKRLMNGQKFEVMYFDLDNFKAYNDVYGFARGDEIIKFTARTIVKNVQADDCIDSFVGHIGGDDFVAIVSENVDYEEVCKKIISEFDKNVLRYFNGIDATRGYLEVANRKGIIEQFPLTSISIGVVIVEKDKYRNILEIGEASAQVKHSAKTVQGSTYVIDKRSH